MNATSGSGAAISALLVAFDAKVVARTMRSLRAQTIARQIEVVLVAPVAQQLRISPEDQAAFHSVKLVEVPVLNSLAIARATGVRHATAPIIAFNEDHSFPEPGWAAALVAAHQRGYGGVAPRMVNANPGSALSTAAMYLHFGGVVDPDTGFETPYPSASHNMSYRREVLLDVGERLSDLMLAELFLHEELSRQGHTFWVEPAAVTHHVNMSRARPAIIHAWTGGRLYGGLRGEFGSWSILRRLVYAGGAPLIPFLRLRRTLPLLRRTSAGRERIPRVLPVMAMLLAVHAAGEAAGYLFGAGRTRVSYSALEHHRDRHVLPDERAVWS